MGLLWPVSVTRSSSSPRRERETLRHFRPQKTRNALLQPVDGGSPADGGSPIAGVFRMFYFHGNLENPSKIWMISHRSIGSMVLRKKWSHGSHQIYHLYFSIFIPAPWILWMGNGWSAGWFGGSPWIHDISWIRNLQTLPNTVCWTNFCCYCCLMNVSQSFTDTSHIVPRQVLFRELSSTSSRTNHVTQHDSTAAFCASRCRRAASRASSLCLHITGGLRGCQFWWTTMLILYDIIWYYMILYDIIWYYHSCITSQNPLNRNFAILSWSLMLGELSSHINLYILWTYFGLTLDPQQFPSPAPGSSKHFCSRPSHFLFFRASTPVKPSSSMLSKSSWPPQTTSTECFHAISDICQYMRNIPETHWNSASNSLILEFLKNSQDIFKSLRVQYWKTSNWRTQQTSFELH